MRLWVALACLVVFVSIVEAKMAGAAVSVRSYAHALVLKRWHSTGQWFAFDAIVRRESGWNPCAYYPHRSDCGYRGSNSCGIPQANPCPSSWRGRLFSTRFAQVRWGIAYIVDRYGDPIAALAYWDAHGSY